MLNKPLPLCSLKIAARSSKLSRAQVQEVLSELHLHHPHIEFDCMYLTTYGDIHREISLRTLDKTDFFTKEIDQCVLSGQVRLGIHSAKDLPIPLPEELICVGLTKGVDPSDVLVLREEVPLKEGAVIATSSMRREEMIKQLYPQARCTDIRGSIEERLEQLMQRTVDGVVIAEAALIRLRLQHLYRIKLPGQTAPLQGRLAIVARQEDHEMRELFSWIAPPSHLFATC